MCISFRSKKASANTQPEQKKEKKEVKTRVVPKLDREHEILDFFPLAVPLFCSAKRESRARKKGGKNENMNPEFLLFLSNKRASLVKIA